MQRREFLAAATAAGAAVATSGATAQESSKPAPKRSFKLKYAPHFGMFRNLAGADPVAQLEFAAAEGFTAWEDNGMKGRSREDQERIAKAMERLGMTMGVFVAHGDFGRRSFTGNNQGEKDRVLKDIKDSVEVAKRVNAKWMTVVPGAFDNGQEEAYQTANCIELLKRCAAIFEPHGMVMVLEPLNWWRNHAGLFLRETPQAYQICRAVGSPSCKILYDIYHQQIQEGNLIPNIDRAWDEIAYFQCGDNPGRNEPGTGEINYNNVFGHIHRKGFKGVMGMEHGNSRRGKDGDQAVIDAYVKADEF